MLKCKIPTTIKYSTLFLVDILTLHNVVIVLHYLINKIQILLKKPGFISRQ